MSLLSCSSRDVAVRMLLCAGLSWSARAHAQLSDAGGAGDAGLTPLAPDAAEPSAPDAGETDASLPEAVDAAAPVVAAPAPAASASPPLVPAASAPALPTLATTPIAAPSEPTSAPATEVTVVGTKLARTAGSAHVLRKKELERWEYDDVTKVLQSVPGVYIRTEDGMGLRPNIGIRGVDPDRSKKVTLLEDGILFGPAPYSAPAAYFFPLTTRMEKLRVIKGPGTVVNGPNTVGGTIDFVTRSIPDRLSAGFDLAAGQYGTAKADLYAATSTEQLGFLIEGVRLQNNGFKELPNGADTGFIRNEWMVKGSFVVDPRAEHRNEFNLKLTYSDEVSNESYLGLTDQDFKQNPNQRYFASKLDRMENHRTSVVLNHLLTWSPKLSLSTSAYRHDFKRTWRKVNGFKNADINDVLTYPDAPQNVPRIDALRGVGMGETQDTILIGPNQRAFVSQGVDSRLRWDAETGPISHRLELGARYHFDSIERRHSQNGFLVDDGQLVPDALPTEVWEFNRGATHAVALHAGYAATFKGFTLTPGIRSELIRSSLKSRFDNTTKRRFVAVFLPGVGAYYAITESLGILAGVYRGFTPPPPGSDKRTNKPENSINYEGGARFTRGGLRLEAIGFYNDYSNLTNLATEVSVAPGAVDMQFDLGKARIYGAELSGEHEIPAGPVKLPVLLAYTFTRGEYLNAFRSPLGNAVAGDEVEYLPRHQLRLNAGVEHVRAGGSVGVNYVGAMRSRPGSGSAADARLAGQPFTDAQFLVDATAYAKVWKMISLYVTVQNLFDSQYIVSRRPFGARPNAPRWVQVGFKGSY